MPDWISGQASLDSRLFRTPSFPASQNCFTIPTMKEELVQTLQFLLSRLERISADSVVAHRASGVRGAMLRTLYRYEMGVNPTEQELKRLIDVGYILLQKAAREIGR
ncbi:MAG TPA: hypothetical protein VF338_00895 [Leptolinea sp.]